MHPYAMKVFIELESHGFEKENLENWGRVSKNCHYFEEVIIYLKTHGPTSVGNLARYLKLEKNAMQRVTNYMKAKKLIKKSRQGMELI